MIDLANYHVHEIQLLAASREPEAIARSQKAWLDYEAAEAVLAALDAELARSTSEPAPQNPPPSPTGDSE
jgi:hypothetical protein